jgi:hypothetical protein
MVKNRGNKTLTFEVKAVYLKQAPNGQMTPAKANEEVKRSLIPNLRFSPKRTTLKPGESQTVRMMLRNVGKLKEGDYRLHLKFLPKGPTHEFQQGKNTKGVGMNLKMRLSIAIPVIYRHGKPKDKVEIKKFRVYKTKKKGHFFKALISKSGNTFPMGTITVFKKSGKSDWKQIGIVKGLTLYSEKRMINFPLREYKGGMKKARFKIRFSRDKEVGGDVLFESTYDYDKDKTSFNLKKEAPKTKIDLKKRPVRKISKVKKVEEYKFSDKKEENYWFEFEMPSLENNKVNIEIVKDNDREKTGTTNFAEIEVSDKGSGELVVEVSTQMSGSEKLQITPEDDLSAHTKVVQGPEGELIELSFEIIDSEDDHIFKDEVDTKGLIGLFESFNQKIKKNLPKYKNDLKGLLDQLLDLGPNLEKENHAKEKIINDRGHDTL